VAHRHQGREARDRRGDLRRSAEAISHRSRMRPADKQSLANVGAAAAVAATTADGTGAALPPVWRSAS
jgi:hypothetical protein